MSKHESREVELPIVQFRNVRTIDVTELALEAFVSNLILLLGRHEPSVLALVFVNV